MNQSKQKLVERFEIAIDVESGRKPTWADVGGKPYYFDPKKLKKSMEIK